MSTNTDSEKTSPMNLPRHVAIILDGNGRWATERGLPRHSGHIQGCKVIEQTVYDCSELGIECLTAYAFSTENWKRSQEEVSGLMELFRYYVRRLLKIAMEKNVRVRILGETGRFDEDLISCFNDLEGQTASNTGMNFCIAVNYGSRDEIVRAVKGIAGKASAREISPDDIDENMISDALDTSGLPDPDLLIRTGGEHRLSNYLLWQCAYSEMYFTDIYWPDFNMDELKKAVSWYSGRQRRFGGVKEDDNV